jgi:hypothetical protein
LEGPGKNDQKAKTGISNETFNKSNIKGGKANEVSVDVTAILFHGTS